MKENVLILIVLLMATVATVNAQMKIKDGTVIGTSSLPNSNAILDLESNNKGLLLPRVALVDTLNPSPLTIHVKGMFVFDTASVPGDIIPGTYYDDGTKWVPTNVIPAAWLLAGNAGTNPPSNGGTNFIGTTDVQDLQFQTNSSIAGYLGGSNSFNGNIGTGNTAFGLNALATILSNGNQANGYDGNLAVGTMAMQNATGGNYNEAFGHGTLLNNTTGSQNLALGWASLETNTTGGENVGVGLNSLDKNLSGQGNIAIGHSALYQNTSGNYNIAIGLTSNDNSTGTFSSNTTGSNNIAIGFNSGQNNVTSSNNIFIGSNANVSADGLTDAVAIGNNAVAGASNTLVLGGTGSDAVNVGIGTAIPTSTLQVNGSVSLPIKSVTRDYIVTAQDYKILVRNTDSALVTITLPDPSTCTGRMIIVENMNPNLIIYNSYPYTGQKAGAVFNYNIEIPTGLIIPAGSIYTNDDYYRYGGKLGPYFLVTLQSDGTQWTGIAE